MSYILEALRRAERERHLGQAPTVQALTQATSLPRSDPGRRSLRLALVAVTLLLAATAAVLLWRKPDTVAIAPPVATTPSVATAPSVAPLPEAPPASSTSLPPPPAASAPAPTATIAPPPAATGRPLQAALDAAEAAEVIEAEDALATLDDLAAPYVADAAPAEDEQAEASTPGAEPAPAAAPRAAVTSSPTPAEPTLLRDMPSSYRARFPPVRLDVHVYNDDPARRWIMVEGRRYRESETLASGPRVIAIRVEGVIFEHAGQRVLFPLTR